MREVPAKNYIIVVVMAVTVIILGLILRNIYRANNNEVYTPIVIDVIKVIQYEDLENYLQENPDVVLYINDSTKKTKKDLEKGLKKLITDNEIGQYIVYIEKSDDIVKKYDLGTDFPVFVAYQNGIITEILSKDDYKISEIESFLIRNKVIEND